MKIITDTQIDTFEEVVTVLRAAYGRTPASLPTGVDAEPSRDGLEDDYLVGGWTRPRLRELANRLKDLDASVALRYIAEHAPSVGMDEVFAHMSDHTGAKPFNGRAMGGTMSAVGSAGKGIGDDLGPVYETDYGARTYHMDEQLASALLSEMDAYPAG